MPHLSNGTLDRPREGRWKPCLAAFFIPLAACILVCIGRGIWPFGSGSLLIRDSNSQYLPFFLEFLRKLKSGGSLMYSWNLGLGSDFVAVYAYYLASPLNWLVVLVPEAYVTEFMEILILIKIGLCGLTFFLFLRGHFRLVGKDGQYHASTLYPALLFSTAYALSGFICAYEWDVMWLDGVALFPVIMLGLDLLVKERRCALYCISLAVCILSNYYIAIPICISLVFYFVFLFITERPGPGAAARFAAFSLLSGGSAAVLIVPEAVALSSTASAESSFPRQVTWYFNLIAEYGRGSAFAAPYFENGHWPNLYAGAFTLLLMWLFFMNGRIRKRTKLACGAMVAFFFVSFAENQLDYVWHGFHFPRWLPGRQSFIYAFLVLAMGFAVARKWKGVRKKHVIAGCIVTVALLALSQICGGWAVTEIWAVALTAALVCAYGILMWLMKRRGGNVMKSKLFPALMCACGAELVVNLAVTGLISTDRTGYPAESGDYSALLELAEEDAEDDGAAFFRLEDLGRTCKNDGAARGFRGASVFSSLMDISTSDLLHCLGYEAGENYYSYNGATPLTSAMLGVRYVVSENPAMEGDLYTLIGQSGDECLYECNYCLPLGYVVDEDALAGWEPDLAEALSPSLPSINGLASALGAQSDILSQIECEADVQPGATELTVPEDGAYYAISLNCGSETLTVSHADGWSQECGSALHRYLIYLGELEAGETVTVENPEGQSIDFYVYRLDADALDVAYSALSEQTMEVTSVSDTEVTGTVDVREEGRLILSVPADSGWTLCVDGEETEIEAWEGTLISAHLAEGEHEIVLTYETPGLRLGALMSLICVAAAALLAPLGLLKGGKAAAKPTAGREI